MELRREIESYTPALRRFAQALVVGSKTDVVRPGDDLVHESILRALKFAQPVHSSVRLLLYASLVSLYRKQSRITSQSFQHLRARQSIHAESVGAVRSNAACGQNAVETALATLDLDERATMLLVVLERLSYRDAAYVMDMTQETLLANLTRARARFALAFDGNSSRDNRRLQPSFPVDKSVRHLRLVK